MQADAEAREGRMNGRKERREPQEGRAILRLEGDRGQILFPDRGQQPLTIFIERYQRRIRDGFGSHRNGRHKLG